ncbi:MAG TPA: SMP-30/gluconolactonase/LRE family protein [Polyangia bacterium]|nr:SMP-30/gluconolactonase/LRE family protein [Polyangia bacterium]
MSRASSIVSSSLLLSFLLAAPACTGSRAAAPPASSAAAQPGLLPGAGTPAAIPSSIAFVSLEGPLWVAAQHAVLFSDVVENNAPGAAIYRFDPTARSFARVPYPGAPATPTSTNGLGLDASGALLACERVNGALVRIGADGKRSVLADRWPPGPGGASLNAPNDLVVRRDGNVYFTDTDWGVRPGGTHAPTAVYRIPPTGPVQRVLEMTKPNGIALSPDGATLYIGSDTQAKLWKLPVDAAGATGAPALFVDGAAVPGGFKVPDGICVDDSGNLYVANNADEIKAIVVFDPAGRELGRIPFPVSPSNCTFGGNDRRTMYVTTLHALYEVPMPTPGLP